jgi:hypothetical protein
MAQPPTIQLQLHLLPLRGDAVVAEPLDGTDVARHERELAAGREALYAAAVARVAAFAQHHGARLVGTNMALDRAVYVAASVAATESMLRVAFRNAEGKRTRPAWHVPPELNDVVCSVLGASAAWELA